MGVRNKVEMMAVDAISWNTTVLGHIRVLLKFSLESNQRVEAEAAHCAFRPDHKGHVRSPKGTVPFRRGLARTLVLYPQQLLHGSGSPCSCHKSQMFKMRHWHGNLILISWNITKSHKQFLSKCSAWQLPICNSTVE